MRALTKVTYAYLFLMLFIPFFSYYTVYHDFRIGAPGYFRHFATLFGFALVFLKYKVPNFSYLILLFSIYFSVWPIITGLQEERTFLIQFLRNPYTATFFILIIVYNTNFNEKIIRYSIFILKVTVVISLIVSVIQVFDETFWNAALTKNPEEYRFANNLYLHRRSSIYGYIDPNALGLAFIPLLSVLIGKQLYEGDNKYILFLIMGGIVALLSNGRYIIVGFLILTLQVLLQSRVKIKSFVKYTTVITISIIAFTYSLTYLGYDFKDWGETRLFAEENIFETTRYHAIETFALFFPEAPIFGTGGMTEEILDASAKVGSSHIHIGYLSHLVSFGIFGCFFLFGFWFLLFKRLYKTAKITGYWGSFFAFLTFLWSFTTMSQSSIFFYGLIFALVFDKYYTDKFLDKLPRGRATRY